MHESQQEDSEHTMVTLPFLNHEVPSLTPADGNGLVRYALSVKSFVFAYSVQCGLSILQQCRPKPVFTCCQGASLVE